MTLHTFFLGGTALRCVIFAVGIYYCLRLRHRDWWIVACHVGSILVLLLIVQSRPLATLVGIPVTVIVVERLTRLAEREDREFIER